MSDLPPEDSYLEGQVIELSTKLTPQRLERVEATIVGDPASIDVPDAPHVIERILPRSEVCLFAADGGAGKSTLALSMAMHVAAGRKFAGLQVEKGLVCYLSLEDRLSTCLLRIKAISAELGFDKANLGNNLHILTSNGLGSALGGPSALPGRYGQLEMTPLYSAFQAYLPANPALIVIDNASGAFTGNENARNEVDWFLDQLIHMASEFECPVMVIAHLNKNAVQNNTKNNSYSGSTAWNNAPRSRLSLIWDANGGTLYHEKANLGPKADPITITRNGPVLIATVKPRVENAVQKSLQVQEDADAVLKVMRLATEKEMRIPANQSSGGNIFKFLASFQAFPGIDNDRVRKALTYLELGGTLKQTWVKVENGTKRSSYVIDGKIHDFSLTPPISKQEEVGASSTPPPTPTTSEHESKSRQVEEVEEVEDSSTETFSEIEIEHDNCGGCADDGCH